MNIDTVINWPTMPLATMPLATLEHSDGGIRLAIFIGVVLFAVPLAVQRSSYLVDYFMVVVCFNRFVRRLLDWIDGQYDPLPISSLLPAAVASLAVLVVLSHYHQMPRKMQLAMQLIAAALVMGFLMGIRNGLAAIVAMLEYVMPFGLLFYAMVLRVDSTTIDRWIRTMTSLAVVVAIYGWYQWVFVPPWDAAWLEWSRMWTSMGQAVPYEMSVFSTLESRGPYAWFMAAAIVPMMVSPRWRPAGSWIAVLLVASASVLSMSRSGWALSILALVLYAAIRGGQSMVRVGTAMAFCLAVLVWVVPQLPQSDRLIDRVETVGDLQNDQSFRGRTGIIGGATRVVIANPLGLGLGTTGVSQKATSGSTVIMDNGLLDLLITFGLPGFLLLASGLWIVVRNVWRIERLHGSELAALGLAQFGAGVAAMIIANWLAGPYSAMVLVVMGGISGAVIRADEEVPLPVEDRIMFSHHSPLSPSERLELPWS